MLRLLVAPIVLLVYLLSLPFRLLARRIPAGSYVLVELDGAVADFVPEPTLLSRLQELGQKPTFSLHAMARLVALAAADPRVRGVVLVLRSFGGGMARATALRDLLARLRAAGREVIVQLPEGGGTKELYVALAGSRIFLGPQATLAPMGFLSTSRYVRRALDKAGLVPEVFAAGRYKSAGESLSRDAMSDENREQVEALLDVMYREVVGALGAARQLDPEHARQAIDGAPYHGEEAVRAGLVDGVCYEDELPGRLAAPGGATPSIVFAGRYLRATRALRFPLRRRAPVVGVVAVHGAIAPRSPFGFGPMAIDDRVIGAVRLARANPRVRAVVLHVDSPGGSALASDRIHHELEQLAAEKPLIACFSDVAASGGYYVGAAAHAIVAQPTTLTGSIGVVAARVVADGLLEKLGVTSTAIRRGARAGLLDPTAPLDDDERRALEREIGGVYKAFVDVVARGRGKAPEEVLAVAEGRVWAGADAHRHGLVDHLGGFEDALALARERAGLTAGEPLLIRGPRQGFPPLNPPQRQAGGALADLAATLGIDLGLFALAARHRVLLWSETAGRLR